MLEEGSYSQQQGCLRCPKKDRPRTGLGFRGDCERCFGKGLEAGRAGPALYRRLKAKKGLEVLSEARGEKSSISKPSDPI